MGVFSSLRLQLIATVVGTVAAVLLVSHWIDTTLSERAIHEELQEQGLLMLHTASLFWGRSRPAELGQRLETLVEADAGVEEINVLDLRDGHPRVEVSTARQPAAASAIVSADDITRLLRGETVTTTVRDGGNLEHLRITIPLRTAAGVVGAAQAELRATAVGRLRDRVRRIDLMLLAASMTAISLVLSALLQHNVTRPVAALVGVMRAVERGALDVRATTVVRGELGYLQEGFNSMLVRIEDLTRGLEWRVGQATLHLAEKNVELEGVNAQLSRAQQEIARSERLAALGQLAGEIAHELGTPLNSVLGYVQLLRRGSLKEQETKLAVIESQVQRMIDTIRSVLARTRDVPMTKRSVDINTVVAEALTLVGGRASDKHLVLQKVIAPDIPPVPGDPIGLRQVLLNLLTNAIDATAQGGTVGVQAALGAGNGAAAVLDVAVTDTGHGMSGDEVQHIFEPFYTTKEPERGSGLGMVIVDYIVRAHGGDITVDSAPGVGTTVHIQLPLEA
jgi:two-component system NtrC family sensor kinase